MSKNFISGQLASTNAVLHTPNHLSVLRMLLWEAGSGAFLNAGFGSRFFPDLVSWIPDPTHISESLVSIFCVKNTSVPFQQFKTLNYFQFV
jgi:hypothetical protein